MWFRVRLRRHRPWRGRWMRHRLDRVHPATAMGHHEGPGTATAAQLPGLGGQRVEQRQQQTCGEDRRRTFHGWSPLGSNCCKGTDRAPAGGVNSKSLLFTRGLSTH